MTGIVSVQQMKEIEKACNDMGIDYLRLMENAGSAAAAFIRKKSGYPWSKLRGDCRKRE